VQGKTIARYHYRKSVFFESLLTILNLGREVHYPLLLENLLFWRKNDSTNPIKNTTNPLKTNR